MKKNVHVKIFGRVQGVWFRASTKQKAEMLGITGWVKNTDDGCVEAIFEGEEEQIDKMIDWCHFGSSLAKVKNVDVKKQEIVYFENFEIKH